MRDKPIFTIPILVLVLISTAPTFILSRATAPSSTTTLLENPPDIIRGQPRSVARPAGLCTCLTGLAIQVTDDGTVAGTPVAEVLVQLRLRGQPAATGVTNSAGVATMTLQGDGRDYEVWVLEIPDGSLQRVGHIPYLPCPADNVHIVVPISLELAAPTTTATVTPVPTSTMLPAPTPVTQNIELISRVGKTAKFVQDVYATERFAYVTELCDSHLWIVDISDPSNPIWVGDYDMLASAYDVHVVGNHAYVAAGESLRVIDISDPAVPSEVGYTDVPGWAKNLYVVGDSLSQPGQMYAYVTDGNLRIIDVSDPSAPTEVGVYDGFAEDVYVVGNTAYVAANGAGLRVIDVSSPTAPTEIGVFEPPASVRDIFVTGDYAYALAQVGLYVVDVSDPTAPIEVAFLPAYYECPDAFIDREGAVCDIYVAGDYAYVAEESMGLRIVDISNPAAPVEVGVYSPAGSDAVSVAGGHTYLAAGRRGLLILRFAPPGSPTATATVTLSPTSTPTPTATPSQTVAPSPSPTLTPTPTRVRSSEGTWQVFLPAVLKSSAPDRVTRSFPWDSAGGRQPNRPLGFPKP